MPNVERCKEVATYAKNAKYFFFDKKKANIPTFNSDSCLPFPTPYISGATLLKDFLDDFKPTMSICFIFAYKSC